MRSRWRSVGLALALAGCASSSEPPPKAAPDRTGDPDFEAARGAAAPEFETQAEALAAGVYEPFVHPDSIAGEPRPSDAPVAGAGELTTPRERGDPSTAELVGTLGTGIQYNQGGDAASRGAPGAPPDPTPTGVWTLQAGAFDSETGALVRTREIEHRFPDLPVWYVKGRDGMVRVYVGSFDDRAAADRALERLAAGGYPDAWVTRAP